VKRKYLHAEWTKTRKPTKTELKQEYKYIYSSRSVVYSEQAIYGPDELPRNVDSSFQNTSGKIEKKICGYRLLQDLGGSLSRLLPGSQITTFTFSFLESIASNVPIHFDSSGLSTHFQSDNCPSRTPGHPQSTQTTQQPPMDQQHPHRGQILRLQLHRSIEISPCFGKPDRIDRRKAMPRNCTLAPLTVQKDLRL
jgi:hypothetical protein